MSEKSPKVSRCPAGEDLCDSHIEKQDGGNADYHEPFKVNCEVVDLDALLAFGDDDLIATGDDDPCPGETSQQG